MNDPRLAVLHTHGITGTDATTTLEAFDQHGGREAAAAAVRGKHTTDARIAALAHTFGTDTARTALILIDTWICDLCETVHHSRSAWAWCCDDAAYGDDD